MKNKILLTIADGLGDRPCTDLGGKTPLEYATKPHLNYLAKNGTSGIMDVYQCGVPVGTDLGHMLLFGYNFEDYPGRGPIEAFGEGVELEGGDVAFRANFATVDDRLTVLDRRAGRIRNRTKELAAALNGITIDNVKIIFKEATEHRAVLVLRGKGLSAAVSDSDPKVEGKSYKKVLPKDSSPEAAKTADILNCLLPRFHEILAGNPVNVERIKEGLPPANFILTRGAGIMPNLEKITKKYGFTGACVAAESTVLGVAKLAGFTTITDARMTGNIDTDVQLKARLAIDALKKNDFVCLHMKCTDLMGHDNKPKGKAQGVELYDKMLGYVLEYLQEINDANVIIAMAADHSTPCERREHSGDPVPVVIAGKNIRKDDVEIYDEIHAAQGGLNRITGKMFNTFLLDYLEVIPKQGN
jgi:2,3-bisphosphoglycerate-independent phosphoglycerate mutase